jgi:hypothetical protein
MVQAAIPAVRVEQVAAQPARASVRAKVSRRLAQARTQETQVPHQAARALQQTAPRRER